MKKCTLLPIAAFAAFLSLTACEDEFSNMPQLARVRDTIFKTYPTVAGVSAEVEGHNELIVVVRSAQLYSTNGENKQKIASEIANMANIIFGTNNELDRGHVTFSKEERSTDMKPADGQDFPISFPK